MKPFLCFLVILFPIFCLCQKQAINKSVSVNSTKSNFKKNPGTSFNSLRQGRINIGDTVPDIELTNLLNYPAASVKLSAFKGKLFLIDFFTTTCGACVGSFRKLDTIQKTFGTSVQVVSVTTEDKAAVIKLFNSNRNVTGINMPTVTCDKTISPLFAFRMVPHIVWVGPTGKVLYTTNYSAVTQDNVEAVLKGKHPALRIKQDDMDYDYNKALLANGNGRNEDAILYRSVITRYIPGITGISGKGKGTATLPVRIYANNTSILSLYKRALNFSLPSNRIIINTADSIKRTIDSHFANNSVPDENTLYCYELMLPEQKSGEAYRYMQKDLDLFFNLHAAIEKRLVDCYVMIRTDTTVLLTSKGEKSMTNVTVHDNQLKFFYNLYLHSLIYNLNQYEGSLPVIDETGYNKPFDYVLNNDLSNLTELKKALSKYGLTLKKSQRPLDVLVISQQDY